MSYEKLELLFENRKQSARKANFFQWGMGEQCFWEEKHQFFEKLSTFSREIILTIHKKLIKQNILKNVKGKLFGSSIPLTLDHEAAVLSLKKHRR